MLTRETMRGPWAGLPVAWNEDLSLDEATYREDVALCCKAGIPGVYTGGTTGEFYAAEFEDFKRIVRATVEVCKEHGTPVMIGVTHTSTLGATRRAAFAKELGADAVQAALPFWMEVDDREVVPFFLDVAGAAEGLTLSIYETTRAKKALTLEQHRAVRDAAPAYTMVKANAGTLGGTAEGCAALSEFVNVFVGEGLWAELGPKGAVGCCSALVYASPRIILDMWRMLRAGEWEALKEQCARLAQLSREVHAALAAKGYTDSAFDRLHARVSGFLNTSLRVRGGPYRGAAEEDLVSMREWLEANWPEFLEL